MDAASRVSAHFMDQVRDLTPAGVDDSLRVLYAPVVHNPEISNLCASILSPPELQRLERKAGLGHQAEFSQRRAFRRYCASVALGGSQSLSELVFEQTGKGRPYLDGEPALWFSFSSCRSGMLGAWSSAHGIGVDIEEPDPDIDVLALARQFFSPGEISVLEELGHADHHQAFYRLWSLKEAALKSIGEGLPFGLDAFELELHPHPRFVKTPRGYAEPGQFFVHEMALGGRNAALVMRHRSDIPQH